MPVPSRPLPRVSDVNEPMLRAAAQGRLLLQRCRTCAAWIYYPRYVCPWCLSAELDWQEAAGTGTVVSYSAVHRPQHPYFLPRAPVLLVAVALTEGPVVIADLPHDPPERVRIGAQVRATFERVGDDLGLVHFALLDRSTTGL